MFLKQGRRKLNGLARIAPGHDVANRPAIVIQILVRRYGEPKTVAFHTVAGVQDRRSSAIRQSKYLFSSSQKTPKLRRVNCREYQTATVIRYSCPFVPGEWIAAHGLRPLRAVPPATRAHCPDGACPYAHAYLEMSRSQPHSPFIFTTTCDQMRRHAELADVSGSQRIFLMHVPTTWQTPAAVRLYRDELERLGRFLCHLGGASPSPEALREAIRDAEARRDAVRSLSDRSTPADWPETLQPYFEGGDIPNIDVHRLPVIKTGSAGREPIPLALVGSPFLASQGSIHAMIAQFGGQVVLDGTGFGERAFPQFDQRLLAKDPLSALVDAYFCRIPDAFRRPNEALYDWMDVNCARRQVRGIVFHHQLWCDTWHAEAQRMKERLSIPLLSLETGGEAELGAHILSRLQAFLENLK